MNGLNFAKYIIFAGIAIVFFGIILMGLLKIGVPLGNFPGDIHVKKEKIAVYFPIVSSILISIGLTILINFVFWIIKKF
ncbi:MAG: DUF2905 domain-containing protein [Parachlamydiales bacterium]|jgi:hypothetical protein